MENGASMVQNFPLFWMGTRVRSINRVGVPSLDLKIIFPLLKKPKSPKKEQLREASGGTRKKKISLKELIEQPRKN